MAIKAPPPRTAPATAGAPVERRQTKPVVVFAVLGMAIILFEAYVYSRWITGPRFERVNSGPDSPPDWMKVVLNAGQVLSVIAAIGCLYWIAYRPFRRDGRMIVDGLFALSFLVLVFQDPISSYFGRTPADRWASTGTPTTSTPWSRP